ncbi:hypothetical protein [Nonomuraea rubra]|uniref:hypothetical protein n=1 Tax=Nonomuraea rubra TaxID=46180 RepID=UPI0033D30C03
MYGDAGLAPVDSRDIAAVVVPALLDERIGEAYVLTGPLSRTQIERVRIIAETIGRPLRFEERPREQFQKVMLRHGMPTPVVAELRDGLAARAGRPGWSRGRPPTRRLPGLPAAACRG